MLTLLKKFALLLLCLLAPLQAAQLFTQEINGVECTLEHFTKVLPLHGPARFTLNLKNNTNTSRVVSLNLAGQSKSFKLAPFQAASHSVDFFVSDITSGYGNTSSSAYSHSTPWIEIEVDRSSQGTRATHIDGSAILDLSGKFNALSLGNDTFVSIAANEQQSVPADWRYLAGYQRILIDAEVYEKFDLSQRRALLDFVKAGGILLYASAKQDALQDCLELLGKQQPELASQTTLYGHVHDDFKLLQLGLGRIVVGTTKNIINDIGLNKNAQEFFQAIMGEQSLLEEIHKDIISFAKKRTLPLSMAVVLCLFAVSVGPLNLRYWAKAHCRHRLFISVPLISLVTCVLMVVLTVFGAGINGKGQRYNYIQLDNSNHSMLLSQIQSCDTGMLVSNNFNNNELLYACNFFSDTQLKKNERTYRNFNIDYSPNGSSFKGNWFANRSTQQHFLSCSQSTRSGISLQGSRQKPLLTSGFEQTLQQVYVYHQQRWYVCENLAAGQSLELKPADPQWSSLLEKWPQQLRKALLFNLQIPKQGCFVAFCPQLPIITSLESIDWQNHVLVSGIVDDQTK